MEKNRIDIKQTSENKIKERVNNIISNKKTITENLIQSLEEFSAIERNIDNIMVDRNGEISGFKYTDKNGVSYNNLPVFYNSKYGVYHDTLNFIDEIDELIKEIPKVKTKNTSYNKYILNLINIKNAVNSAKFYLDNIALSLGKKINKIYDMNFSHKPNQQNNENKNHHDSFYFSSHHNIGSNVEQVFYIDITTLPTLNEIPILSYPYGEPISSPNTSSEALTGYMNLNQFPTENQSSLLENKNSSFDLVATMIIQTNR